VKRFLSRTCGTMKFALQVFDPSGDGRFDRTEWEAGLQKLGYVALCDVQALFSALDKRQHHVLTLSDLLDKYSGMDVFTGIPKPGLMGIVSEIIQEAMVDCLQESMQEALQEAVQAALLSPSGPQRDLPDLKRWLKKQNAASRTADKKSKKAKRQQMEAMAGDAGSPTSTRDKSSTFRKSGSRILSGRSHSPRNRSGSARTGRSPRAKTGDGKDMLRDPQGRSGKGKSGGEKRGTTGSSRGERRATTASSSTERRRTGAQNSEAGTIGTTASGKGKSTSPGRRRKRQLHGRSSSKISDIHDSPSASPNRGTFTEGGAHGGARSGSRGGARKSGRGVKNMGGHGWLRSGSWRKCPSQWSSQTLHVPDSPLETRDSASTVGERSPDGNLRFNPRNWRQAGPGPKSLGKTQANGYPGYRFVDRASEFPEEPSQHLLRWVPRPVEDVCKTYPHVYRMMESLRKAPQKRSLHLSVPRVGPTSDLASSEVSASRPETPQTPSEADAEAPGELQTVSTKAKWRSKSSPQLFTGMTGASTTAGTFRPASAGCAESPGDTGCSLPPLAPAAPMNARPDIDLGSSAASAIDFESRLAPNEIFAG